MEDVLAFIAQSAVARALKSSRYVYPAVNAAHILALATLFGSILALDVRLLGAFRSVPVRPLAAVLPRVAAIGLGCAVVTGALLFTVEPLDYARNPAFLAKGALILAGSAHALTVHASARWRRLLAEEVIAVGLRVSAALSLALWSAAILAGRLIAY